MLKIITAFAILYFGAAVAKAEVQVRAQYNLKGQGGIRDVAAPEILKSQADGGPDLIRRGAPKVMSDSPAPRRQEYDSSLKFEGDDQCYSAAKNLAEGDNFVLEVWAYALKGGDEGFHMIVANGDGGSGTSIVQTGDRWQVLVGGAGSFDLGKVRPATWTHLAVLKSRGAASGWLDGKKACLLPGAGGGRQNFSIGATAPGKEAFRGWVAEVRYATFAPGKFDPATDFLLDVKKMKVVQAEAVAGRAKLVDALIRAPGAEAVARLDERPAAADWLVSPPATAAGVQVVAGDNKQSAKVMLSNGLVSRTFLVKDNLGCVSLRRSDKDLEFVRAVKPEVRFRLGGGDWIEVGGLTGATDHSFLMDEWDDLLESKEAAFRFAGMTVEGVVKPLEWSPKCNAPAAPWPAKGKRVAFHFVPPPDAAAPIKDLRVDVEYELYDGMPTMMKTFTVFNKGGKEVTVDEINNEYLAVNPDVAPLVHAESDYAFAVADFTALSSGVVLYGDGGTGASRFKKYWNGGGTTKWEPDGEWNSMATLNPTEEVFMKNPQNCLLVSKPLAGPGVAVKDGGPFQSFRTIEIFNDADDKERQTLAQRRMYKALAPWTTEHQLEVHLATHDTASLRKVLDQMADTGFERLQIETPAGISLSDTSPANVAWLKEVCDYAGSKGLGVGGYELIMCSAGAGPENDCVNPNTGRPGSGQWGDSWCACSAYGERYAANMFKVMDATGLSSFKPDGGYTGDPCASTTHPGHRGLEDSQWQQWRQFSHILAECQRRNVYVTVPEWYFLNGQTCTGMGYREAADNLPIAQQLLLSRQYIFDGTFHKTAGMGWINLNTASLHGGPEEDLDRYRVQLFSQLSSGAEVWLAGYPYDGPRSKAMVAELTKWRRKYQDVIQGDIIHLRRADGRGLDYTLHVNPGGREKGMLLVFNPTARAIARSLDVPLYYTGLTDLARVREQEGEAAEYKLDRDYKIHLPVKVAPGGYSWYVFQ